MLFGEIIRNLREDRDLKQEDIAKFMKVDRSTVGKWESGSSKPDYEKLVKLADYYGVSLDYILGQSNTKTKDNSKSEQATYIESLKLDTPEDAIKFILQQPSIMEFGGYNLNEMDEDEIMALANDLLFAMKLSLEKYKKK